MILLFPFWFTWLHGVMVGMMLSGVRYNPRMKEDDRLARMIEKNRHRIIDWGK